MVRTAINYRVIAGDEPRACAVDVFEAWREQHCVSVADGIGWRRRLSAEPDLLRRNLQSGFAG